MLFKLANSNHKRHAGWLKRSIDMLIKLLVMPLAACGIYTIMGSFDGKKLSVLTFIPIAITIAVIIMAFNNKAKHNRFD